MKIFFTLIFITLLQISGFSQKDSLPSEQAHFSILIESVSWEAGSYSELSLDLESKGIYTFKMSDAMVLPVGVSILVKDILTGNAFLLNSGEPHSFSVNRAMTKKFRIQIMQTPATVLVTH